MLFKYSYWIKGALLCLFLSTATQAEQPVWADWFNQQIQQHPDILAAKAVKNAAIFTANRDQQPLYNPELESELEREGTANNFRLGINQTLDWSDKLGAQKQQAELTKQVAEQIYLNAFQNQKAAALTALIEWQIADQEAILARRQEKQLSTFLKLIKARQQAGDLSELDAELAFLSLSQKLNDSAQASTRLIQAEIGLNALLPAWSQQKKAIPAHFWDIQVIKHATNLLEQHPKIMLIKAQWQQAKQQIELTKRQVKADPTFGVNAGRSGGDNVLALTFSMPLNIRNNFNSNIKAANQQALAVEADYQAIYQQQQAQIKIAQATLQAYQKRFKRWQSLMRGRNQHFSQLLEKQWQSGDFSTTEYLQALSQQNESLKAGIALKQAFYLAAVDWLSTTGQIEQHLAELKQ